MQKDDRVYLGHMYDATRNGIDLLGDRDRLDFDGDLALRLATTHLLQIIGEAARKISLGFREAHPEIPWKEIIGMRHRVVHDYFDVDEDMVWRTCKEDLPALARLLLPLVRDP